MRLSFYGERRRGASLNDGISKIFQSEKRTPTGKSRRKAPLGPITLARGEKAEVFPSKMGAAAGSLSPEEMGALMARVYQQNQVRA